MTPSTYIPRFIQERVEEALTDTPVVLIHGPRQGSKTTLARHVGQEKGFACYSFDDVGVRSAAEDDPAGFVAGLPGRFILTGSANILRIPRVSDSLAGRMEIIRLHPLSRCEILGRRSGFIDDLFAGAGLVHQADRLGDGIAELAAPFRLSRPTIGDYVTRLEQVFLIQRLPAWRSDRLNRLIKAPRLHLGDTGVACAVLNHSVAALREDRPLLGHLLETWVVQELRRQASWSAERIQLRHFRTKEGAEVDAVLERAGRQIAGVEVKLSGTVVAKDFRGLKKLQEAVGSRFSAGVVPYDGEVSIPFGEGLFAVPLSRLWTGPA